MTDICYVISHGFAARMVMQTNLLGQLVEEGKSVTIIVPDKNDATLKAYCEKRGVAMVEYNETKGFWNANYLFKRKYYLEDIRNNPALWEKHMFSAFFTPSLHPFRFIRPHFYYLIYLLIKLFPVIRKRFQKNEKKYLESVSAREILEKINPKVFVSTYPVTFLEALLLYQANQREETKTCIHLLSWDNITCKGAFPALADYYIAWGDVMAGEFKEYYQIPDDKIMKCGVPHFDLHVQVKNNPNYEVYLDQLGLNPKQEYLFVAMSAPRFTPREIDVVEQLAKWVEEGKYGNTQLVIRPHPQNMQGNLSDKSWLPRLKELNKYAKVAVDFPELENSKMSYSMKSSDMERLSQLLTGARVVVNSGSTVTIDALMHQKPVVIISFDANDKLPYWRSSRRLINYTHLKKLVSFNGVSVVKSFLELDREIEQNLTDPNYKKAERRHTLEKECEVIDGTATEAVKTALINIVSEV